jgi:hypothetical protein
LNLGDHCWGYRFPRAQWQGRRTCPAFDNPEIYRRFRDWQKEAHVKSRHELRREVYRSHDAEPEPRLEGERVRRRD